jgi:hypothetical protein
MPSYFSLKINLSHKINFNCAIIILRCAFPTVQPECNSGTRVDAAVQSWEVQGAFRDTHLSLGSRFGVRATKIKRVHREKTCAKIKKKM